MIIRYFPNWKTKEWWIEQAIRVGSWITIIVIFLAMRDIVLSPPLCPVYNFSFELIENLPKNITQCICSS